MHKVIFIPFYAQCPHLWTAASARFRAEWPAKYLGAAIVETTAIYSDLCDADLVIFQKTYNLKFLDLARRLKEKGIKIAFDLCDAEWINREVEIKAMIEAVDFVTVSTVAIKAWIINQYPKKSCYIIPDGHDLDYYKPGKPVKQNAGSMNYVWYGNSGTILSLRAIMGALEANSGPKDTLTIIADECGRNAILSDKIGIKFVPWQLKTVNNEIRRCNLVLNPKLDNESYRVKSNNKTAMAYILGLPCIERMATDEKGWTDDLINLRLVKNRKKDVMDKRDYFLKNFNMTAVAKIWQEAINQEFYDKTGNKKA